MESFVVRPFNEKRTEQLLDVNGIADGFLEVNITHLQKDHAKLTCNRDDNRS